MKSQRRTGGRRQSRKDKRERRGETSHPPMFARSATETADRGSASSATRAVVNDSDAVPSYFADGRMPTTLSNVSCNLSRFDDHMRVKEHFHWLVWKTVATQVAGQMLLCTMLKK